MYELINSTFRVVWVMLSVWPLFILGSILIIYTSIIVSKRNSTKRVLLWSKEFELMVRGEWCEKDDLKISFHDIGYDNMHDIIDKIQNEKSKK